MSERDAQINQLIQEACRYARGSKERNRRLNRVIRLISPRIWREHKPYYADALQQTWLYFSNNICEASTTSTPYDPERGNVVTWLNAYLKRRLQDGYIDQQKELATQVSNYGWRDKVSGEENGNDPISQLPAAPDIPPMLETVKEWIETDPSGVLRSLSIEGHPQITAQVLLLRRLPPEEHWESLSKELGPKVSTLNSFYQRKCLPELKKFGAEQGYL